MIQSFRLLIGNGYFVNETLLALAVPKSAHSGSSIGICVKSERILAHAGAGWASPKRDAQFRSWNRDSLEDANTKNPWRCAIKGDRTCLPVEAVETGLRTGSCIRLVALGGGATGAELHWVVPSRRGVRHLLKVRGCSVACALLEALLCAPIAL